MNFGAARDATGVVGLAIRDRRSQHGKVGLVVSGQDGATGPRITGPTNSPAAISDGTDRLVTAVANPEKSFGCSTSCGAKWRD
jgi:hypothetical protein